MSTTSQPSAELAALAAEVAAASAAQSAPPPAASPSEVVLEVPGTGEVFKGATLEEAAQKLAQAKANTTTALRDRERQIRELQAVSATPPGPDLGTTGTFSSQKYFEIWEKNPLEAQNYLDSFRPEVQQVMSTFNEVDSRLAAAQFTQRCPDYPVGDPQVADALMAEMDRLGRNADPDMMALTWYEMRDRGAIKPVNVQEQPQSYQPPRAAPIPVSAGSPPPADAIRQFENMSTADMEAYLKKIGMKAY